MKNVRRASLLIISMMLLCSLLLGCVFVPEEYTKGVKLDRDYPDDDMPIYDEAIVYFSEEDEGDITIEYGVADDLDDVVDFYKDHFEDNDIVLDSESDKSSKYSAQGFYKNFAFTLKISKPNSGYEEKQFATIVMIEIEFTQDSIGTVDVNEIALEQAVLGFWRQESFSNSDGKFTSNDSGTAYEFLPDGVLNQYRNFEFTGAGSYTPIDNVNVLLTYAQGDQEKVSVVFEKRSGYDYMIIEGETATLVFYKDSADDFTADGTTLKTPPPGTDSQLAAALADIRWYYVLYSDVNGETVSTSTGNLIYNSDGTLEDTFEDETVYGTWYVLDGWLNCDYSDDTSSGWIVEVKIVEGIKYLYFYSNEVPAFWLYSSVPLGEITIPTTSTTYTTDGDLTAFLAVSQWVSLHYLYADGSTEPMDEISINFYADGSFDETYTGTLNAGTWYCNDGNLITEYSTTGNAFHYPAVIENDDVSNAFYLYLGDLEEGSEGNYWVFTTYLP